MESLQWQSCAYSALETRKHCVAQMVETSATASSYQSLRDDFRKLFDHDHELVTERFRETVCPHTDCIILFQLTSLFYSIFYQLSFMINSMEIKRLEPYDADPGIERQFDVIMTSKGLMFDPSNTRPAEVYVKTTYAVNNTLLPYFLSQCITPWACAH